MAYSTASKCASRISGLPLSMFSVLTPLAQTDTNSQGQSVTTLWRAIRANKEDRVAKLEWAPNGGLGRAIIGKVRRWPGDLIVHRSG